MKLQSLTIPNRQRISFSVFGVFWDQFEPSGEIREANNENYRKLGYRGINLSEMDLSECEFSEETNEGGNNQTVLVGIRS